MKFTFKGYIKITAKLMIIHEQECIRIEVEDTGIGIKKQDLKKLFKMFSKISQSKQINKSGVGLGLMISYNYSTFLTYKNGPGIQVKSQPNVGSNFFFFLVNKKDEMEIEEQKEDSLNEEDNFNRRQDIGKYSFFRNNMGQMNRMKNVKLLIEEEKTNDKKNACDHPKVLVVDDSEYNIYAIKLLLQQFNVEIDTANNGKTAVDMIVHKSQDNACDCNYLIVLMDCNMPVMDGFAACEKI